MRWPRKLSEKVGTLTLAVGATVLLAGGVLAMASGIPTPKEPTAEQIVNPAYAVRPVSSVDAQQRASFAILRRVRRTSDDLPSRARSMLDGGRISRRNVDLARAIQTPSGQGWVIPASNRICIAIPDPVDGYGLNCVLTAEALEGALMPTMSGGPGQAPGEAVLVGLVPDDARNVTLTDESGRRRELSTTNGVVATTADHPMTISFTSGSGIHEQTVGPVPDPLDTDEQAGPGKGEESLSVDCGGGQIVSVSRPRDIGNACKG